MDTIIHIGAGRGTSVPDYLATNAERIVLIEPQPDRARSLRQQAEAHPHVEVIEAAVAEPDNSDPLKVFSIPDLSSLRAPTGLMEILPGLRTTREIEVEHITPIDIVEREGLQAGQRNWLIIDAPGEETATVSALRQANYLVAFAWIDLHCGTTSLYENTLPAEQLLGMFAESGHEIQATDEETDPDRPHWTLCCNSLELANLYLKRQLEKVTQERDTANNEISSVRSLLRGRVTQSESIEQQVSELLHREEQIRANVARAEGQIDLIKKYARGLRPVTKDQRAPGSQDDGNNDPLDEGSYGADGAASGDPKPSSPYPKTEQGGPNEVSDGNPGTREVSQESSGAALLERARTQWQFSEWQSLAALTQERLVQVAERDKLAALAATAHLQLGNNSEGRRYARLALEWGCPKDFLGRVLLSGAYNSLAVAQLCANDNGAASPQLEQALALVTPQADIHALSRARSVRESAASGLLPQAAELLDNGYQQLDTSGALDESRMKIFETELEQLRHELSLAHSRGQLEHDARTPPRGECLDSPETSIEELRRLSTSQIGQDLWVLEKTGFKRGGFFVEFGATDGVALSNTWILEKYFDWSGICAEPNPEFHRQLHENRKCRVANACIAGESGREVEFVLAREFGGIVDYSDQDMHADKRAAYRARGKTMLLSTISLHEFLKSQGAPRQIDYLSIDTEGNEHEILAAFPFEEWDIRFITVEHNYTEAREQIRELLEANGFRCIAAQWDDWYERSD